MKRLYDGYEFMCDQGDELLESMMKGGKVSVDDLKKLDLVTHTLKSMKCLMDDEDGYSGDYMRQRSYARGRKRDSMGRYSRHEDGFAKKLYELMDAAPDTAMRQKLQRMADELE